jgi:transposase InsO family protein
MDNFKPDDTSDSDFDSGSAPRLPRTGGPRPFGEGVHPEAPGEPREGGEDLGEAESLPERAGLAGRDDFADDTAPEVDCVAEPDAQPESAPRLLGGRPRGPSRSGPKRHRVREVDASGRRKLTGAQRLLILDSWIRSKLPAHDFAAIAGVSAHTLYGWRHRFEADGPAGLADPVRRGRGGSRLPEPTRRAILMLKESHPEWGEDRIHDVLMRTEGFGASPGAIGRVLVENGYVVESRPGRPHEPPVKRFERTKPNELWQTDLFTFVLKRENRRVHLVAFMDDYSRFIVGFGLYASASGALVREVFEAAIANFGAPIEVLTDNGTQYHTWRGKSAFTQLCERRGIRQIVAAPRHPQTLGKIERFWGTLWRELLEGAIFSGLADARTRLGQYFDHYNFQRPHQGLEGLVPADRFFEASEEVKRTLTARVQANALELAQHGRPRKPLYFTGRVGDASFSLHTEGDAVVLTRENGEREVVDLTAQGRRATDGLPGLGITPQRAPADHPSTAADSDRLAPGASPLDGILERLERGLERGADDAGELDVSEGGAS